MRYSIALKDLPFEPEERQVIYVENQYDDRINALIKDIDRNGPMEGIGFSSVNGNQELPPPAPADENASAASAGDTHNETDE
jgi:hypothetical protein